MRASVRGEGELRTVGREASAMRARVRSEAELRTVRRVAGAMRASVWGEGELRTVGREASAMRARVRGEAELRTVRREARAMRVSVRQFTHQLRLRHHRCAFRVVAFDMLGNPKRRRHQRIRRHELEEVGFAACRKSVPTRTHAGVQRVLVEHEDVRLARIEDKRLNDADDVCASAIGM